MADLATIEQELTTSIGQQETANGTTGVGLSLNNPGALKYAPWESTYGAAQGANGFAAFPSLSDGFSALTDRINQMVSGGASVNSLVNTYAPPSDGNTNNDSRIAQIASLTGLDTSTPIASQTGGTTQIQNGDVLGQTVTDATTPPAITGAGTSPGDTLATKSVFNIASLTWSRIGAFILGFIFIIVGFMMLKQTQIVVQNVASKIKDVLPAVAMA